MHCNLYLKENNLGRWSKERIFIGHTYSFLSSSLVGFDFHLQFVHQVLQTDSILPVLLSLNKSEQEQNKVMRCISSKQRDDTEYRKLTWYVSSLMRRSYLRIPFSASLLFFCSISTSFSNSLTWEQEKIIKEQSKLQIKLELSCFNHCIHNKSQFSLKVKDSELCSCQIPYIILELFKYNTLFFSN